RRRPAPRRPVHSPGRFSPGWRNGGGVLPVPRPAGLLADHERWRARGALLLHLALLLGRRRRAVEPGLQAGEVGALLLGHYNHGHDRETPCSRSESLRGARARTGNHWTLRSGCWRRRASAATPSTSSSTSRTSSFRC